MYHINLGVGINKNVQLNNYLTINNIPNILLLYDLSFMDVSICVNYNFMSLIKFNMQYTNLSYFM